MKEFTDSLRNTLESILVVFVVLKIIGVIEWPWWQVLAPFWVPLIFAVAAILLLAFYHFLNRNNPAYLLRQMGDWLND